MHLNKDITKTPFKTCPVCKAAWDTRHDFISDPDIQLGGYQVNFDNFRLGFFLFNHMTCRNTLGVKAADFLDLHDGPVYEKRLVGTGDCPGYCLHQSELRPCPAKCECAFVRDVLDRLKRWPKSVRSSPSSE
ncbi:hypothetical protein JW777_07935 [bacterium]|nr:hypothetical protein [bacterium]